ncbi:MAG: ATP-binding cassette domain-containing protein [Vicinamibacterales bacterium]
MDAVRLHQIRKTFGRTTAVVDLDLVVPTGAIYGFIGPNGAGKTTSIRMIMSILFPDSGELSVLGHPSALDAKDRIGYLPEERGVYRKMRVGAFLTYMAQLKAVRDTALPARIRRGLERVGLGGVERQRCEELSKGTLQKVQILAAIIHQPDLLILDEPFSGLDPVSTRLLRDVILEEHRRGATILFSTHVMPQAEEICEHVVMIYRGRKVLDEQLSAIRRQYNPRTIRFEPLDPAADLSALRGLAEVERLDPVTGGYDIVLEAGSDPGAAIRRITAAVTPARIEISRPRLEDIFISIVSEGGAADAEGSLRANLQGLGSPEATV